MMAKNEFRFLNSRQLWTNRHTQDIRGTQLKLSSSSCSVWETLHRSPAGPTHWAAILMNFLRSWTLLLSCPQRQTSVTTHSWTWLNLRRNRSRLAVVLLKLCRPNVWYNSSCWREEGGDIGGGGAHFELIQCTGPATLHLSSRAPAGFFLWTVMQHQCRRRPVKKPTCCEWLDFFCLHFKV